MHGTTTQSRLEAFMPVASTSRVDSDLWRNEMPAASATPINQHTQRVYVMCGVVGSGKSTLAVQWEALYPDHYVRVNQDALGDRRKCEALTSAALLQGKSAIIDRQNFDPPQRYHWLRIGHEARVEVVALVFNTTKKACADRLILRRGHETVKTPEQGLQVLESMTSIFTRPTSSEGFHRIVDLPAGLPLRYVLADINAIIRKVEDSRLLPATLPDPPQAKNFRGGSSWQRGGNRGSGRGRGRGREHDNVAQTNAMTSWLSSRHQLPSSKEGPEVAWRPSTGEGWTTVSKPHFPSSDYTRAAGQVKRPHAADSQGSPRKTRGGHPTSTKSAPGTAFIDVSSDEEGQS